MKIKTNKHFVYCLLDIKKNPNYRHGKTLIKVNCIECKKELSKLAYYYGYKRCKSCAKKEVN